MTSSTAVLSTEQFRTRLSHFATRYTAAFGGAELGEAWDVQRATRHLNWLVSGLGADVIAATDDDGFALGMVLVEGNSVLRGFRKKEAGPGDYYLSEFVPQSDEEAVALVETLRERALARGSRRIVVRTHRASAEYRHLAGSGFTEMREFTHPVTHKRWVKMVLVLDGTSN